MRYSPRRDLPLFVTKYRVFSPSELREIVLRERNEAVTPESVTMWFKRHKDIYEELKRDVVEKTKPLEVVDETVFNNGTFEKLESVENWIKEMRRRKLSKEYMKRNVWALKKICQGKFKDLNIDLTSKGWNFKHPDRLTLDDCLELLDLISEHYPNADTSSLIRIPMRSFLESRGIVVGKKISGEKSNSYGKFARLFIERDKVYEIFEVLKKLSYGVFALSFFEYKTATRVKASLEVKPSDFHNESGCRYVHVVDKGRHSKGREEWDKHIDEDLWRMLKPYYEEAKSIDRPIFSKVNYQESCGILRIAYREAIPELEPIITNPHHFWRHQFAQHMLRATNWNYDLVAQLGGWKDTKTLKECYGKPPIEVIAQWGLTYIPQI